MDKRISIVTGTLNRCAYLPGLLANTVDACEDLELVLVDGGSDDGTVAYLQERNNPRVKLIEVGARSPYPDYMNRGVRAASHDWICQWNDDVALLGDWVDVQNTLEDGYDVYLFAWKGGKVREWTIYHRPPQEVVMNYGIYHRRVFEHVGLYNDRYQYFCCDGDMSYRAWAFGHQVRVCRHIHVQDLGAEKRAKWVKEDFEFYRDLLGMYRQKIMPVGLPQLQKKNLAQE